MTTSYPARFTPDEAMSRLLRGHARFAAGEPQRPRQTAERLDQIVAGQSPFATIIGCSDSRTSPELIFDQGFGNLFVIRVAGEVLDHAVLGSVEYAVEHLYTSLVVVLAHSGCGAVAAAVQGARSGQHIPDLVTAIQPAVDVVPPETDDRANAVAKVHARSVTEVLRADQSAIGALVARGDVKIEAMFYDMATRSLEIL